MSLLIFTMVFLSAHEMGFYPAIVGKFVVCIDSYPARRYYLDVCDHIAPDPCPDNSCEEETTDACMLSTHSEAPSDDSVYFPNCHCSTGHLPDKNSKTCIPFQDILA